LHHHHKQQQQLRQQSVRHVGCATAEACTTAAAAAAAQERGVREQKWVHFPLRFHFIFSSKHSFGRSREIINGEELARQLNRPFCLEKLLFFFQFTVESSLVPNSKTCMRSPGSDP
jgi:hypothetical protein